ncbi:hypothetical protein ACFE04_021030 [Oxalis oulophora]
MIRIRHWIRGDSSKFPRLGYYEMLIWIKLGDQKKIYELCDVSIGDGKGKSKLLVNYLLPFCESDWKAELLQLLNVVDITRVSSSCSSSIFKALGRLSLDSFAEKFIFALKTNDSGAKDIGSCIFNYITSIPNLEVEDAILEFKNFYMKLDLTPSSASFEMLVTYCCQCGKCSSTVADNGAMKICGQILGKLIKYKRSWVFNKFEEMFHYDSKLLEECALDNVGKPLLREETVAPMILDVRRVVGRSNGKNSRKKEMTMKEKMKLGLSLQDLPQDEMALFLHILRIRIFEGKWVKKGAVNVDIGANPSEEGSDDDEGIDDSIQMVVDIVNTFRL